MSTLQSFLTAAGLENRAILKELSLISRRSKDACISEFRVGAMFARLESVGCKRKDIIDAYGIEKSKLSVYIWAAGDELASAREEYLNESRRSYSATGFRDYMKVPGRSSDTKKYPRILLPATDSRKGIKVEVTDTGVNLPEDPAAREEVLALCRRILAAATNTHRAAPAA